MLLGERRARELAGERREPDLIAEPRERGHHLGVRDPAHRGAEPGREELEVLARGVRHRAGVRRDRVDDRAHVDGERIDERERGLRPGPGLRCTGGVRRGIERRMLCPRDLDQTQLRHQPLLGQELEIERHERRPRDRRGDRRDLFGLDDERGHGSR